MNVLNVTEVVIVTIAALAGCIVSLNQFIKRLKVKWIGEAKQSDTLNANTKAIQQLTQSVNGLSARMDRVDKKLNLKDPI